MGGVDLSRVDAGHVLDDLVELAGGVSLGQVVGKDLCVLLAEGKVEGVAEAGQHLFGNQEFEPVDEDLLQRPVELLALCDGHVEQLCRDDLQPGEAEGVDDVARPAGAAIEVVGLEHYQ